MRADTDDSLTDINGGLANAGGLADTGGNRTDTGANGADKGAGVADINGGRTDTGGLTDAQVRERFAAGAHNAAPRGITPSYPAIAYRNIFTLFNFINLALALLVTLVGYPSNAIFFFVAFFNTLMGIVQEVRAKKTLDALAVLSEGPVRVMRNGVETRIPQAEVVLGDVLVLRAGDQICADAAALSSNGLEVDESLLTGEADSVLKSAGDPLLSGSYVTAGGAFARVTAAGSASYANRLVIEAKGRKKPQTPMMRTIRLIIRVLAIVIIPVGVSLFLRQRSYGVPEAALGSAAAMIGMIPEGLVLLTGVAMTIGAIRLARASALVQTLPGIEMLARTDVLCLDKTGTITDGTLTLTDILPAAGYDRGGAEDVLRELQGALPDENPVAAAICAAVGRRSEWSAVSAVPFSSERKWSGACFAARGSYIIGAPDFILRGDPGVPWDTVKSYAEKGKRVLCLAHSRQAPDGRNLPEGLEFAALIALSDGIRPEAAATFKFFADEGVEIKVISGDDPLTVSSIAETAGIEGSSRYIDMSTVEAPCGADCGADFDYSSLALRYAVFGRASPAQKKALVAAMKKNGRTVCMTGDGVNDVPAMKEADCSVAMRSGSGAARGAGDFVLMTSDFSAMRQILYEGRRVINNIETVSALYLIKTIYSGVLAALFLVINAPFPFAPLQVTPINMFTVGIPSFFIALRRNFIKPEGRFGSNILRYSLPAALTIVVNVLLIRLIGTRAPVPPAELAMMRVVVTGAAGFYALFMLSKPSGWYLALFIALAAAFCGGVTLFAPWINASPPFSRYAVYYVPLLLGVPAAFGLIRYATDRLVRAG